MVDEVAVAGRLEVLVEADLSTFGERLRAGVIKESKGVEAKVGVEFDADNLRSKLETIVAAAAQGVSARVGVEVDETATRSKLDRVLTRLGRKLKPLTVATETDNKLPQQIAAEAAVAEGVASATEITVPVNTDGTLVRDTIAEIIKAELAARAVGGIDVPINPKLPGGSGGGGGGMPHFLRRMLPRAALMAAVGSLIQPAVGSLMAGVGGLTAMAGAAAPALGVVTGAAPGLAAIIQGAVGATVALGGTGEAIAALAEKEKTLAAGGEWTVEQQKALTAALKDLTPSARKSVKEMAGLRGEWVKVKKASQEAFFAPLVGLIKPLGDTLLPTLREGLAGSAGVLGELVGRFAEWAASPAMNGRLGRVMGSNNKLLASMGDFLFNATDGMLAFLDAARPFTARMGRKLTEVGEWFNTKMQTGAEDGSISEWLNKAANRAELLWSTLKSIGGGMAGIFRAGDGVGKRMLTDFSVFVDKWHKWVDSDAGQLRIGEWFTNVEPAARELGLIIKDIGLGLLAWAEDPHLADMLKQLRTELLPALGELLTSLGEHMGPAVIDLLTQLVEVLNRLEPATEVMSKFIEAVALFINALVAISDTAPGATTVLAQLLGVLLAFRTVKGLGKILGLALGLKKLAKGGKALGPLAAALAATSKNGPGVGKAAGNVSKLSKAMAPLARLKNASGLKKLGWLGALLTGLEYVNYGKEALEAGENAADAIADGFANGAGTKRARAAIAAALSQALDPNDNPLLGRQTGLTGLLRGNQDLGKFADRIGIDMDALEAEIARVGTNGTLYKRALEKLGSYGSLWKNPAYGLPFVDTDQENAKELSHWLRQVGDDADAAIKEAMDSQGSQLDLLRLMGPALGIPQAEIDAYMRTEALKVVGSARAAIKNVAGSVTDMFGGLFPNGPKPKPKTPKDKADDTTDFFTSGLPKGVVNKAKNDAANQGAQIPAAVQRGVTRGVKRAKPGINRATNQLLNFGAKGRSKGFPAMENIAKGVQTGARKTNKATTGLTRGLTRTVNKVRRAGTQISNNLGKALAPPGVKRPPVNAALNNLGRTLDRTRKRSGNATRGINRNINQMGRGGSKAFTGLSNAASNAMTRVQRAAQKGMNGATRAVSNAKGPIKSAAAANNKAIVSAFNGLQGLLNSAGAQAMAGLRAGIQAAGGAAIAAAQAVANAISAATRSALKINSPSLVMAKIGTGVPEGLAKGIKDNGKTVVKAARGLTDLLLRENSAKKNADATKKHQDRERKNDAKHARGKEALAKRLSAAERKLSNLKSKRSSLVSGAKESYKEYGSISTIADSMGGYANPAAVLRDLGTRLKTGKQFKKSLAQMRKNGMGKRLYEQLLEMGVEAGAPIVEQLKGATPKQLKRIERMQAKLAKTGAALGNKAGDQLYKSGIRAANALVNQLRKRKKALGKAMENRAKDEGGKGKKKGPKKANHAATSRALANSRGATNKNLRGIADPAGRAPVIGQINQHIYDKSGDDAGREVIRALRKARLGGVYA